MKIFGNTSSNPAPGKSRPAVRPAKGEHSAVGLHPVSFPGREQERPANGVPTQLELYHSQILRALFLLFICVIWSGCKTSPPPAEQDASALNGTGHYSVIVLPVFIVRSASASNDSDAPPRYNQGYPETVPFEEPDRKIHAHEASLPPPAHPSDMPAGNLHLHNFNQPQTGFAGVPSAGAQTHSSADEQ